jgi:hypothetical protein
MTLDHLPDYPALRQVASALWKSGAAVLVGAGFSRNATRASPATPKPPLWDGLAREMGRQLYADRPSEAPRDALRLAEEYRAFYGQAALDEFVRANVRDQAWTPGEVHKALLELPWSDVLTTNYDTLLERAASEINSRSYELVRLEADLAHTRPPRIVKLHGSLGTTGRFTIAEDDYRTYPTEHAAFVNLARQSFLENDLCLLGFSGDDANFLQWAGWVRDRLKGSTRRIYLVGVLNLSPSKRRYLESRNIAPIDLSILVKGLDLDEQHSAAATHFVNFLLESKPPDARDWRPADLPPLASIADDFTRRQNDAAYAAELFRGTLDAWEKDRLRYPGWLICPSEIRTRFHTSARLPVPTDLTLSQLSISERGRLSYELCWRHSVSFTPIDKNLSSLLESSADLAMHVGLDRSEQLEIALALLEAARERVDDETFNRLFATIDSYAPASSDIRAAAIYQKALKARDDLDFDVLENLIPGIVGDDPMWGLRKAALLCELAEFERADQLVTESLAELRRRQRQDRTSLWVTSRRAWAEWFAAAIERNRFSPWKRWSDEFIGDGCDPWKLINDVNDDLRTASEKCRRDLVEIKPHFEPGTYSNTSDTIHFGTSGNRAAYDLIKMAEVAAIPQKLTHMNLLGDAQLLAMEFAENVDLDDWIRTVRTVSAPSHPLLERFWGRASVAALSPEIRSGIVQRLERNLNYWRPRAFTSNLYNPFVINQIRTIVELLSRLVVCESEDKAIEFYRLALNLASDQHLNHWWLFEHIGNLAYSSSQSVSLMRRDELAIGALEFATANEKTTPVTHAWPDASRWLITMKMKRPAGDLRWTNRISQLIELVGSSEGDRTEAVVRLTHLCMENSLVDSELYSLGKALWAHLDDGTPALPKVKNLYPSAFGVLPAPPDVDVMERLRERLFQPDAQSLTTLDISALVQLSEWESRSDAPAWSPSQEAVAALFDQLVSWRPKTYDHPISAAFERQADKQKLSGVGLALGRALSPALALPDRTTARFTALCRFLDDVGDPTAMEGLPYFAAAETDHTLAVVGRIRRGIHGVTFEEVRAAVASIVIWDKITRKAASALPDGLVEKAVAAFEARRWVGLTALINGIRRLVDANSLTPSQIERLDAPLGDLLIETEYSKISWNSLEAVSVSLVRQECVCLADRLSHLGVSGENADRWLEISRSDPLPEVRHAY